MGLANFFDKNMLAASHVLKGLDASGLREVLKSTKIGIAFTTEDANSFETRTILELTVNLIARLYPDILILLQGNQEILGKTLANSLIETARAINPDIEITVASNSNDVSAILAIGLCKLPSNHPCIYIGSDGWIAKVSTQEPVSCGSTRNPFGAAAAACFGAANLFRIIFNDYLEQGDIDRHIIFSLLDFSFNKANVENPSLSRTQLGESFLIGVGAIGNGAIWALSKLEDIEGKLHLIDPENIETTNLQRYVLCTQNDIGKSKVEVAGSLIAKSSLEVSLHPQQWGEYLNSRSNFHLERVAVAVDSAKDRCSIQASLPQWIVNAWTQLGNLGVSKHEFLGDFACLMCLYLPNEKQKNEDMLIAEAVGLSSELMLVRELLYKNTPMGYEVVEKIARSHNISVDEILEYQDKPLRTFYTEAICGGVILALKVDAQDDVFRAEVPLAFQSALAGILLASELVIHANKLRQTIIPNVTSLNLLKPLTEHILAPVKKHTSGYCICQDEDYISVYKSKYVIEKQTRETM